MKLYEKKTLRRILDPANSRWRCRFQILTFYYVLGFCVYIHEGEPYDGYL